MSVRHLLAHPFVTDNLWYGSSSFLVNVLNYAYLLLSLQFLAKETFGAFNALVALLTLAAVVGNPLLFHVTRRVASLPQGELGPFVRGGQKRVGAVAGVGLLFLAAGAPHLSARLNVAPWALMLTGIVAAVLFLATFANGVSAGLRKLRFQAVLNLSATAGKVLFGLLLYALGLGLGAGLAGYLAGFALTAAVTGRAARRWEALPLDTPGRAERRESLSLLVLGYLFVAIPFSMDQVLVQVLAPGLSGDYAALATLGKLVFFVSSPFLFVLYSHLVRVRHDAAHLARYFVVGTLVAVGAAALFSALLWLGGRDVVGLLLTPAYIGVSGYVPAYSLGMCGYVFAYGAVLLGMVRNDGLVVALVSLASLAQVALFSARHDTLAHLVANQLWCLGILTAAALAYLAAQGLRHVAPAP